MQFSEECIFRENIEQDHYNTYSSVKHSDSRKTLYLALDGRGVPRKVQVTAARQKRQQMLKLAGGGASNSGSLGKLSTYARVLTRHVHISRVEELARRILVERQRQQLVSSNSTESVEGVGGSGIFSQGFRHHGYNHLCPVSPSFVSPPPSTVKTASRCAKRGKGGMKIKDQQGGSNKKGNAVKRKKRKRKCIDEEDADKCRRERKKRKNMKNKKSDGGVKGPKRNKNQQQPISKRPQRTTTAFVPSTTPTVSSSTASD